MGGVTYWPKVSWLRNRNVTEELECTHSTSVPCHASIVRSTYAVLSAQDAATLFHAWSGTIMNVGNSSYATSLGIEEVYAIALQHLHRFVLVTLIIFISDAIDNHRIVQLLDIVQ